MSSDWWISVRFVDFSFSNSSVAAVNIKLNNYGRQQKGNLLFVSENCLQEGVVRRKCLQRKIFALGGNKATGLKGLSIKIELRQSVDILHICENKITKVKCKVM